MDLLKLERPGKRDCAGRHWLAESKMLEKEDTLLIHMFALYPLYFCRQTC